MNSITARAFAGVVLFTSCAAALAASAEPSLAQAKAENRAADDALNAAYQRCRDGLTDQEFVELRVAQQGWIKYRDGRSEFMTRRELFSEKRPVETAAIEQAPSYTHHA